MNSQKMALPQEKAQCVSRFIEQISETAELSRKEIHHQALQFVHGAENLWKRGQCSIKTFVLTCFPKEELNQIIFLCRFFRDFFDFSV